MWWLLCLDFLNVMWFLKEVLRQVLCHYIGLWLQHIRRHRLFNCLLLLKLKGELLFPDC
ncbi:hypothetical protein GLYMA_11G204333v4 [Glycine max]|nr:hypothetical protein GYH30_031707 [Glycine max]KRH31334.2 hypothetical protein GLYMA_11G204333v4 [Glycine max]